MKHTSEYVAAHMEESRKKNNRTSILTYIIFALVATIIFSGSTLSRYTHMVKGFDEADVIVTTIYLTEDMYSDGNAEIVQSIDLEGMTPGMTLTKYIKIRSATPNAGDSPTNISSSPQNYSMEISSLGVLPLTFTLTPHTMATGSEAGFINNGEIATVNEALIQAGDNSNIYKLEIYWPESENDNGYNGTTDRITIRVRHQNVYGSNVVINANVDKIQGPVTAGQEVRLSVNLSHYQNAYAGIQLNEIFYEEDLLEFVGFDLSGDFNPDVAYIVSNGTAVSSMILPYDVENAATVSGGKFVTMIFKAKQDITRDTSVSVGIEEIIIYTNGEADGWVETALVAVEVTPGGIYTTVE